MASKKHAGDFMEEFICSVCLEPLNFPVTLLCGHNFCKSCIDRVWGSGKQPSCPECREECTDRKYAVNRQLGNVVKRVKIECQDEEGPNSCEEDQLCTEHKIRLELFCKEDGILVCSLCVPEHHGHTFLTMQKALDMYKDKLTTPLSHQQSSLKHLKEIKCQQEIKISEITTHARSLQLHITSEFAKLHHFLQEKEENLVQQLKEEETGILKEMEENLRKIKEDINAVQESVSNIYLQLQQQDALTFLKEIKSFTLRLTEDQKKSDVPNVVAGEMSLGVYKGPLQYSVWKEMNSILNPGITNLVLDNNTAHPNLILSEDLTSIKHANKRQEVPDYPERFSSCFCVLGSEGFMSGRHYWEVEVENKTDWRVGVTRESINRKGYIIMSPENGYWCLCYGKNVYEVRDTTTKHLRLREKPQRIGTYLDCEGGQVSFYNADNMSHLYTFTGTFTERLYPLFNPCRGDGGKNAEPLKLFHLKL
ncbi:zinc-binding protein A33-like isoform X2 [Protopterus annectens]|uniref:zinc-binding protein A33-like isoform X2 n=1 Tax=Protopterus annectens TaxID=7888 RepID=UPI001CF9366F|nr:zinc-binding protein A33-like isoform X2 [Protopterus annectens]